MSVHTTSGALVYIDSEAYYQITAVEQMEPFLMSVISYSDLWMWISSTGALTAGRIDADHALFPYSTDDRIHRSVGISGPITALARSTNSERQLWRPFVGERSPRIRRALYKHVLGNKIIFEEYNSDWELCFRTTWAPADSFGWVRTSEIINNGAATGTYEVLDGIVDIMPAGVRAVTEQLFSNLADSYKRSQIGQWGSAALYTMESLISDRAIPAEALTATMVWSANSPFENIYLDERVLNQFMSGAALGSAHVLRGRAGSYLLHGKVTVAARESASWIVVADTNLDHATVSERIAFARSPQSAARVAEDIALSSRHLTQLLSLADGFQTTNDAVADAHHLSNTLFNTMRGGLFLYAYRIPTVDLNDFLSIRNKPIHDRFAKKIAALGDMVAYGALLSAAQRWDDLDLLRLLLEYLPLTFSRRHGDPSRPWNRFSINVRTPQGDNILSYEGNWRDIFQNWEALLYSFPRYTLNVVAKFVNASTPDGHNSYRINRTGIEWEDVDPENPWSNIGYWGDHQIIYLLRLLEAWERFDLEGILFWINMPIFSYANVPYVIADYDKIVQNPRNTISFDSKRNTEITARVREIGSDGRLVVDAHGAVVKVHLLEKLLVPMLAKMSAFVPQGGIWMHTQRPEWNDANNALAGYGVSMVTLFYLRRYVAFLIDLMKKMDADTIQLSIDIAEWLRGMSAVLHQFSDTAVVQSTDSHTRRAFLSAIGAVGTQYRRNIYTQFRTQQDTVQIATVVTVCNIALTYLDATIAANRRSDGLFHSYNLIAFPDDDRAEIHHLPEMLEGQVAALSSGNLNPDAALALGKSLYESSLYAADRDSFLLYPSKELPSFLQKNSIPSTWLKRHAFLQSDSDAIRAVIRKGVNGQYHFCSHIINEFELQKSLQHSALTAQQKTVVHNLYEAVFQHHAYTGRSGSMYKYEGLGSIYWHMVSKLQLAVHDTYWIAHDSGASQTLRADLAALYRKIRDGLGYRKSPLQFGAIPTDCYSHTPANAGAQQPGMTGQVKEEIICRYGELGIRIFNGCISLQLGLLNTEELFASSHNGKPLRGTAHSKSALTPAVHLTVCGVNFEIIAHTDSAALTVTYADGHSEKRAGDTLTKQESSDIFNRSDAIQKVQFFVTV